MKRFYEKHIKALSVITLISTIISFVGMWIIAVYEIDGAWFNYACIAGSITFVLIGWHCFMTIVAIIKDL